MHTMYTRLNAALFALLFQQLPLAAPSRILLMPFAYRSHVTEIGAIGGELAKNGHDVHILLPASYPDLDRTKAGSGFGVVEYPAKERDIYSMPDSDDDWIDVALNSSPLQELRTNVDGWIQLCTNPLDDADLVDRLRRLQFDLALVDAFPGSRCLWILAHLLGVPYASLATQVTHGPTSPAVMGKSQSRPGFKSRFEHMWRFDSNCKDSIQKIGT